MSIDIDGNFSLSDALLAIVLLVLSFSVVIWLRGA